MATALPVQSQKVMASFEGQVIALQSSLTEGFEARLAEAVAGIQLSAAVARRTARAEPYKAPGELVVPDGIVGGASFAGGASLVVNARPFWSHGRRIRRLLSARLRSQVWSYSMFVRCANFILPTLRGLRSCCPRIWALWWPMLCL